MKQNYVNKEALVTLLEEQLVFLREQLAEQFALDEPTNERLQKDVAEVEARLRSIHAIVAEAERQLTRRTACSSA